MLMERQVCHCSGFYLSQAWISLSGALLAMSVMVQASVRFCPLSEGMLPPALQSTNWCLLPCSLSCQGKLRLSLHRPACAQALHVCL